MSFNHEVKNNLKNFETKCAVRNFTHQLQKNNYEIFQSPKKTETRLCSFFKPIHHVPESPT